MTREVAALFCPGRGSYGKAELGFLASTLRPGPVADAVEHADRERAREGLPTLRELDGADRFRPALHLAGRNAAELIAMCTLAHAEHLRERYEIAVVAGNSLGWYTALGVAGSLTPEQTWRLVSTMARLQELARGGQLLTTTLNDDWHIDPVLSEAVELALQQTRARGADHFVAHSIRLGGHAVLAGTELGLRELESLLPEVRLGTRDFPFRLAGHGPFHTELCTEVAERAREELADLPVRPPEIHLCDGRGDLHTPFSAEPLHLLRYTVVEQVTSTFDFSASVRTTVREFCPDVLVCAGPHNINFKKPLLVGRSFFININT